MRQKQFKTESKKLLDMMINSIYTHKEIFLRELISNASDAIDKLYFRSLTDQSVGLSKNDFFIKLIPNKESRTLQIIDNGCGMTREELENNLGTIAKSGSLAFREENKDAEDVDVIGQFGVGFYSAFMVSGDVTVETRAFGSEEAFCWNSKGVEGYTVTTCEKQEHGTIITLKIKENSENENYDDFLDTYHLSSIVKKYSDYIRYPVKMDMERSRPKEGSENEYETIVEEETLNSMVPLWRKAKSEITAEEYNSFYSEKFFDYEAPLRVIHSKTEGSATYDALIFIPSHAPFDFYSKDFEKGLCLYSKGVLITEKCGDLLPDYFSFAKGLVDSEDLSLNISREVLQHDYHLKLIAKTIEKKIKSELSKMLNDSREDYEKFYKAFGTQLKFGVYDGFGANKDNLKDLLMFYSSSEEKPVTLAEYVSRMKEEQKSIYYACGETVEKIGMLPQTEAVRERGFEVLYLTENIDEFALKMLNQFEEKTFSNICADDADFDSPEEKENVGKENEESKEMLGFMQESVGEAVSGVRFTGKLKNHPVCLTSEGSISLEMEKTLNAMPNSEGVKAKVVLEINLNHPIAEKLKALYSEDKETLKKYSKILYSQARLIEGLSIEDPAELSGMICDLMV